MSTSSGKTTREKTAPKKASNDAESLFTFFNEIGIISQLATSLFEQQLPPGLTQSQFGVLNWFVRVDGEASPGRLAKAFQVTGGAMTNTLKKLEAKGYVQVVPDERSGRQKRVTLTREGRQVRDQSIRAMGPVLAEFSAVFDTASIARQTAALAKVRQYLDEARYS